MKKIIAGTLMAVVLTVAGIVNAAQVPPLINFQSVLYDDAGEPIPDGSSSVNFRITDINGSVLYEENQTLDVVHGMVSAMVGNGLRSNGSPTGGLPMDVFETDAGRYLEVTVDDYQPQATMEIVSVPYALYADKAMGAVDNSIDGAAIKPGSITAEHFSSDALKELGGAMITSDSLSMTTAAQSIGVRPGFSYSGSSNIQGVLTDLDRTLAVNKTQADAALVAEAQARATADTNHANATTGIHGVGDAQVVGTTTAQTLSNKTYSSPSISGAMNMNGNQIEGLGNPNSGDDAVSQGFADNRYVLNSSFYTYKRSSTGTFSNDASSDRDTYCFYTSDDGGIWWCNVTASCDAGDILVGCSGYYNYMCWGDAKCEYMGSYPIGNTCRASAGQNWNEVQSLTAHAICMNKN